MRQILVLLILAAAGSVWADGVTDFVIPPAAGASISAAGSYRLTSDGSVGDISSQAIVVNVDNVTIDLNGHTIKRTSVGGATARAIVATGRSRVRVTNGRIVGYGGTAVTLGAGGSVEDVVVEGGGSGILTGEGSRVSRCTVRGGSAATGDAFGITVGARSIVRDCIIEGNTAVAGGFRGIAAGEGSGCSISGCGVTGNTGQTYFAGIEVVDYASIVDNVVTENKTTASASLYGIQAYLGGVIRGNSVSHNAPANNGTVYGIYSQGGYSLIEGNQCDFNGSNSATNSTVYGIAADSSARITGNITSDNDGTGTGRGVGISVGDTCTVERNTCVKNNGPNNSYGILVNSGDCVIRENMTASNTAAGIRLGSGSNRVESNRCAETTPISDVGGNSLGAGDLANVGY